ncbi:MAG: hypothetical protein JWM57_1914 [Phycisphaerales bacterium]|nr:hypothetical protein [Phycisphaerales bacterium]
MKLTNSQKICFGLLAAGICAFAVDQLTGAAGTTASLIDSVYTIASGDSSGPAATNSAIAGGNGTTLAARLAALTSNQDDRLDHMRDAFVPSPHWITERPPQQAAAAMVVPNEHAIRFRQNHVLKAIVQSGGRSQAWVDASLIELGQTLDGFTLTAIRPMAASFTRDGHTVDLSLPDAKATSTQSLSSPR